MKMKKGLVRAMFLGMCEGYTLAVGIDAWHKSHATAISLVVLAATSTLLLILALRKMGQEADEFAAKKPMLRHGGKLIIGEEKYTITALTAAEDGNVVTWTLVTVRNTH